MNAVEIGEVVSALARRPFDAGEFPLALLQALENKRTTIKWLRSGASNRSDVDVVAAYKLYNINEGRLEKMIHRIFPRPAWKSRSRIALARENGSRCLFTPLTTRCEGSGTEP